MPIYEFYCQRCHTIFSFLSRRINTDAVPPCPKCKGTAMERMVSQFAATGRASEESADGDLPFEEAKMEGALDSLAQQAEGMDENDPRQAASLMRKLSRMTGMKLGEGMEEALSRMEAGEDPEQIEEEMGDRLNEEEPFLEGESEGKGRAPRRAPA